MDAVQGGTTTGRARSKVKAEAPLVPKTAGDRARLALITQPGTIRLSDWATTDRARANRRARSYTIADPRKLDPDATGSFEARVYHDAQQRKYRIAVRYTPTPPQPHDQPMGEGSSEPDSQHAGGYSR